MGVMNEVYGVLEDSYEVVMFNNTTANATHMVVPDITVVVSHQPFTWGSFLLVLLSTALILLIGYLFLALYHKWLRVKKEREALRATHEKEQKRGKGSRRS